MRWQGKLAVVAVAVIAGMANHPLRAQGVGKYFAAQDQVIAIRAGQLFDSRSGSIRNNQVVLIIGDRMRFSDAPPLARRFSRTPARANRARYRSPK
jgi:hypothetical protein